MTCIGIKVRACLPRGRALSLVVKCSTRTQDMQTTWLSKVLRGQEKHKSHKARCSPCNINHPNGVLFSWTEDSTGCVKVPRTSSKAKQRRWKHKPAEWHVIVHKSGAVEKWHAFVSSCIAVFAIRMHFFRHIRGTSEFAMQDSVFRTTNYWFILRSKELNYTILLSCTLISSI